MCVSFRGMAQFGAGPTLAAQCPRVPPPDGWRAWLPETDGPVPDALASRAQAFASDASIPLGATESYPLPGVTTLLRIEPRVWGRDAQGGLVQGCFRTGGIFLPDGSSEPVTPPTAGIDKAVGVLTAVSLAVGTVVTLSTWKRRRKS